jgi:hypothetical protein
MIAAVLAVAIGLRQTAGEALQGTWLLLWRLPARRAEQLLVKVLAGGGLYLLTAALPIAIFAAWAATPGTHASPFYWSMTVPVWTSWFGMTLLYLGAFLSGLRPGRWCGSRLLPLVAALPPLYFLHVLPPWLTVALVVLLGAGLLVCIVHVASACDDN